jgi:hypothetical protein
MENDRIPQVLATVDRAKAIADENGYQITDVLLAMAIDEIHLLGETVKDEGTATRSELQSRR